MLDCSLFCDNHHDCLQLSATLSATVLCIEPSVENLRAASSHCINSKLAFRFLIGPTFYATADEADAYMFYRCFFVFCPFLFVLFVFFLFVFPSATKYETTVLGNG